MLCSQLASAVAEVPGSSVILVVSGEVETLRMNARCCPVCSVSGCGLQRWEPGTGC